MVVVDGSIDWDKQTKEGNTEPRSLENFGMLAGIKLESDADSKGEVVSADDVIPAAVFVSAGPVAAAVDLMTKLDNELANHAKWNNSGKNLYKLIDSSMSVRTKRGLGLDKYIREGKLGIDDSVFSIFHTNSDELEGQPIYNRFALVDHMKAVPLPLTGNYMPPSNIPDIDESQMVYGTTANDSSEIKTNDDIISHSHYSTNSDELEGQPIYNRFALVDHMKAVPLPLTGNYMPPSNIPDIDESQMVYGTTANDSSEIKTNDDIISHSHYSQNIVYAGPTYPISVGQPYPISASQPYPVSAGQPNLFFVGQQNTVSAGPPNPVYAG
nr:ribonuclease H-like domain, reverse transcriptase, RNA-dependent DNA polymerase [Tanacetum cinerariifolium]